MPPRKNNQGDRTAELQKAKKPEVVDGEMSESSYDVEYGSESSSLHDIAVKNLNERLSKMKVQP